MRFFLFFLLVIGFFFIPRNIAQAATLKFDPDDVNIEIGETFDLDVVIDGTDQMLAADARIIYPENLMKVTEVVDGSFFTVGKKDCTSEAGKCYIAAIVQNPAESKTGTGVIATITFQALANGTGNVTFVCTPGETAKDSNIAKDDIHATDIIECSKNGKADVVIGTGSSTSATPTPTKASGSSGGSSGGGSSGGGSSSTPSTLPRSGLAEDMLKFAIPGMILVIIGLGMKLFLKT